MLITSAIMKKLQANNKRTIETGDTGDVVLKLFGGGACTWLITEIEDDGDTMWGLCDIGMGCAEFGTVSLRELQSVRFKPFNLPIERDKWFKSAPVQKFRDYYDKNGSLNGC